MEDVYTEIILDLYRNPVNRGKISNPNLIAEGGNPSCGDNVEFSLKISGEKIEEIKFEGSGCAINTAANSILTQKVKGMKIHEAESLTNDDLFEEMGNVVKVRLKCALLGLIVLKKAISAYKKSGARNVVVRGIVI